MRQLHLNGNIISVFLVLLTQYHIPNEHQKIQLNPINTYAIQNKQTRAHTHTHTHSPGKIAQIQRSLYT